MSKFTWYWLGVALGLGLGFALGIIAVASMGCTPKPRPAPIHKPYTPPQHALISTPWPLNQGHYVTYTYMPRFGVVIYIQSYVTGPPAFKVWI